MSGRGVTNLNSDRVKREAPGAYPFDEFENCFGKRIVKVDPSGDPDLFKLGVAMARQGYVYHKGPTQKGNYEFEYDREAIEWLNS